MSERAPGESTRGTPLRQFLLREDMLAGLLFMAVAIIGLWVSRDYPIGSATRMSTGYVPRLLCWVLLMLGVVISVMGMRSGGHAIASQAGAWRALLFVPLSLITFALLLDQAGLILASAILVAVSALASGKSRPREVAVAAAVLAAFIWVIFIWALGLSIQVWPDW